MTAKALLTVTAGIELPTGLALLAAPSWTAELLLGAGLAAPPAFVVARIAGAALIAIAIMCWFGRKGERQGQSGLVAGMLLYNLAAAIVLAHGWFALDLHGLFLWPACVLHTVLAVWCGACLRR